jgi:hypothetical protein
MGCILTAFTNGVAFAAIVVTSGVVDNESTALSGRKGSVSGPFTDNPAPVGGTAGVVSQTAFATAGPVLPIDNDHPSLPGTLGVVTGGGTSSLTFTPVGDTRSIAASASATNSFASMDGGTYLGSASSYFKIEFSVSEPTPWTLTGTSSFSPQDVTGLLRLVGPGGNHAFLTKSTVGPISLGGVLPPGDYLMEGQTSVYEVPLSPAGDYGEASSIQTTLTLVPEPTSALAACLGALVLMRRRR